MLIAKINNLQISNNNFSYKVNITILNNINNNNTILQK